MNKEPNENPIIENEEIETQDKLLEYFEEEEPEKINVINFDLISPRYTAPFSVATDKAINERNKQYQFDLLYTNPNEPPKPIFEVTYNTRASITSVKLREFGTISIQEEKGKEIQVFGEMLPYNTLTEKIKDIFEEQLFFNLPDILQNPNQIKEMTLSCKEIATMLNVTPAYISKNIDAVSLALKSILIKFVDKKVPNRSFDYIDIFSRVSKDGKTGKIIFSFNPYYILAISKWKYTQFPKNLKKTNDKKYPYAYELGKYFSELTREGRNKVTFRSIYERIARIPRFEEVKEKKGRNYHKYIYSPIENSIEHLQNLKIFKVHFNKKDYCEYSGNNENSDDFKESKKYDAEKWLDSTITFSWYNEPNYIKLNASREKAKKEANKIKKKMKKGK